MCLRRDEGHRVYLRLPLSLPTPRIYGLVRQVAQVLVIHHRGKNTFSGNNNHPWLEYIWIDSKTSTLANTCNDVLPSIPFHFRMTHAVFNSEANTQNYIIHQHSLPIATS